MTDQRAPHDAQAEAAVIAALVYDPYVVDVPHVWSRVQPICLCSSDFLDARWSICFGVLARLYEAGHSVDFGVLVNALEQKGVLVKVGNEVGLLDALRAVEGEGTTHIGYYAGIVKRCALQRHYLQLAGKLARQAQASEGDAAELHRKLGRLWQTETDAIRLPKEREGLDVLSADTILETDWPEPRWVVPGILPVGLTILAGRPKVGKSWLGLQLAQAVASGGYVLGQKVEQGAVLYLALEDPPQRLKERMTAQGWPSGLYVDFLTLGPFLDKVGDLRNGGGDRLAYQIEKEGYRLAVIDTLSRSVLGDQSDVEKMTRALEPVGQMSHEQNTAALMIDHHRKMRAGEYDAVVDILGSTAKGAIADTIWGLYRESGKAGAVLAVTGRDIAEQRLKLVFDLVSRCWQSEGDADAIEITKQRQGILEYLETVGEAGRDDVADGLGLDRGNAYRQLQDMVNGGLLVRQKRGRYVKYLLP